MFCFKCGGNMPDTAISCPQCGTPVQNAPRPQPAAAPAPAPNAMPLGSPVNYGPEPPTDGKATASMVLGILSITCFWLLAGIPAIILGHISKSNIAKSMGRLKGDGMATAGLIMGYLSIFMGLPAILIIASIAMPSLIRSRTMANQSGAMGAVRIVNTAQVSYLTTYPAAGYAKSLAMLGPGFPSVDCTSSTNLSAEHACLIDKVLGCNADIWCVKAGYRYNVTAICPDEGPCSDYVITATPLSSMTGFKSFCSTSDGVIRFWQGPPLPRPLTIVEGCQAWPAVQ